MDGCRIYPIQRNSVTSEWFQSASNILEVFINFELSYFKIWYLIFLFLLLIFLICLVISLRYCITQNIIINDLLYLWLNILKRCCQEKNQDSFRFIISLKKRETSVWKNRNDLNVNISNSSWFSPYLWKIKLLHFERIGNRSSIGNKIPWLPSTLWHSSASRALCGNQVTRDTSLEGRGRR